MYAPYREPVSYIVWQIVWTALSIVGLISFVYLTTHLAFAEQTAFIAGSLILSVLGATLSLISLLISIIVWID